MTMDAPRCEQRASFRAALSRKGAVMAATVPRVVQKSPPRRNLSA